VSLIDFVGGLMGRGPRWHDAVRQGAVFRRQNGAGAVETARVLEVAPDPQGIAHVHYAYQVAQHDRRVIEDRRTLNLQSFHRAFGEPVES
jgi:hypothetical protein